MGNMNTTAERLRRANALWHAFLTATGERFDLGTFLKDAELEKATIAQALASGDQKLVALAQDWLRDTGQPVPSAAGSRVTPAQGLPANAPPAEAAKPSRYLRGVR
jgi:hypothetical protein